MITIRLSTDVAYDFIPDIVALDEQVYHEDLQGSYATVKERYDANKASYVLAIDEITGAVVGYLCFFPMTKRLRERLVVADTIVDDTITGEGIVTYSKEEGHSLYLISVVVLESYRDSHVIGGIVKRFKRFLREQHQAGYRIEELFATAVSTDGEKFVKRLHFVLEKELAHGYKLFRCSGSNLEQLMDET